MDNTWLWGTAPVQDTSTGRYHAFTMAIHDRCGINHYRHNAYIVHGTSVAPLGPYTYIDHTLYIAPPFFFKMAQNLDLRCVQLPAP